MSEETIDNQAGGQEPVIEKAAAGGEASVLFKDEAGGGQAAGDEAGGQAKLEGGGVVEGDYDLKMPEGVEVDQELATALSGEFKELGLNNAQAQRLVDKYIEAQQKRMETQSEKWGETISGWVDEAKADKEIGGIKWNGTVSAARRAVEQFGTPALAEYLNASGGGNHVEMIRFMAKVGAMLGEDKPAMGGGVGGGKPMEAAHILFGNDARQ